MKPKFRIKVATINNNSVYIPQTRKHFWQSWQRIVYLEAYESKITNSKSLEYFALFSDQNRGYRTLDIAETIIEKYKEYLNQELEIEHIEL